MLGMHVLQNVHSRQERSTGSHNSAQLRICAPHKSNPPLQLSFGLLQASWEVMSGIPQPDQTAASMGVFIGMQQMEYGNLAAGHLQSMGPFTATGGPFSVAAGRLSYIYGLQGPAVCKATASCVTTQDSASSGCANFCQTHTASYGKWMVYR